MKMQTIISQVTLGVALVYGTLVSSPANALIIGSSHIIGGTRLDGNNITDAPNNKCWINNANALAQCPSGEILLLSKAPSQVKNDAVILDDGSLLSTVKIVAFDEKQNIELTEDVKIWGERNFPVPHDPDYDATDYLKGINIPAGNSVSSHLIFLDPLDQNRAVVGARWSGKIHFNGNILGIFATSEQLTSSNFLFGLPKTKYDFRGRSLDYNRKNQDIATFSDNTLSFDVLGWAGMDPIRVITIEEVPEPLTILGTGLALGMGVILKRKSLKSETGN